MTPSDIRCKCPKCGRYMSYGIYPNYTEYIGVYSCTCGYNDTMKISYNTDKTTMEGKLTISSTIGTGWYDMERITFDDIRQMDIGFIEEAIHRATYCTHEKGYPKELLQEYIDVFTGPGTGMVYNQFSGKLSISDIEAYNRFRQGENRRCSRVLLED